MSRLRISIRLLVAFLLFSGSFIDAAPQRMVAPSGAKLAIPPNRSGLIATRCIDPHLDPPSPRDRYSFVGSGGDAVVRVGDGPEIPLADAIKNRSLEVFGVDSAEELSFRNLTNQQVSVRFRNNTVLAPEGAQGKELDALQDAYKDFDVGNATLDDGWTRRYLWELKNRRFAGDTDADRIKRFQREFKLPETAEIDYATESAIDRLLERSEGFRERDPDLGRVLLVRRLTLEDRLVYAIYDSQTGRPLLDGNGVGWTSEPIEDVRLRLIEEAGREPPLESLRFEGMSEKEIDAFRNTLQLGNLKVKRIESRAYYRPSKLVEVGAIVQEPGGTFAATLKFVSVDEKAQLTFRSRIKRHVETAIASVIAFFTKDRAPSIERAAKLARKSAIEAGIRLEELEMTFVDEAGMAELVLVPAEVDWLSRLELARNDFKPMAISSRPANDDRRLSELSAEFRTIRLLASSSK